MTVVRRFMMAALVAVSTMALGASSAQALQLDPEVGVVAGANWNQLGQPADPEGEWTFMWGTAFTGFGAVVGPSSSVTLLEVEDAAIRLSADLLYGYHRGAGFADHTEGGRIDVLLTTHVVRLPLLLRLATAGQRAGLTFGVGAEPIFGLVSTATVETTDIDEEVAPVHTTPATSVAGVVALGFEWRSQSFVVPFDLRFAWNPFVADASEDRFEGFESPHDPGQMKVAFDWQIMATTGIRFSF